MRGHERIDDILRGGLHAYLADLIRHFDAIGDAIGRTYFYYEVVA